MKLQRRKLKIFDNFVAPVLCSNTLSVIPCFYYNCRQLRDVIKMENLFYFNIVKLVKTEFALGFSFNIVLRF